MKFNLLKFSERIPSASFQVDVSYTIPEVALVNREENRDLLTKGYSDFVIDRPNFTCLEDLKKLELFDHFHEQIEIYCRNVMKKVNDLEVKVIKQILSEWGFDVSDHYRLREVLKETGIYLKNEYEKRPDYNREYLWLVNGNKVELVSIKRDNPTSYLYSNGSATVSFSLYLSREVKDAN